MTEAHNDKRTSLDANLGEVLAFATVICASATAFVHGSSMPRRFEQAAGT